MESVPEGLLLQQSLKATFTDMPVNCFNIAAKNVQERLKICMAIASYVEDFAECENSLAKSLNKVSFYR